MKIDWKRKLTSRKLWMAIAGFIAGLVVMFGGSQESADKISGSILSGAAVVGYILGEGLADNGNAVMSISADTGALNDCDEEDEEDEC